MLLQIFLEIFFEKLYNQAQFQKKKIIKRKKNKNIPLKIFNVHKSFKNFVNNSKLKY